MSSTSHSTQDNTSTKSPWAAATPELTGILSNLGGINPNLNGNQTGAINSLVGLAKGGNSFAPAIKDYANTMLAGGGPDRTGGVNDAYKTYTDALNPTARGDYLDPNKNPWMSTVTSTIGDDVQKRIAGLYAGSGRDPAGAGNFGYTLGRGVAEGVAPVFGQQYQQERTNQLNAQGAQYGAGNTTAGLLSALDQERLANKGAGVDAAGRATNAEAAPYNAMLAAEAQRQGIPLSLLQQLSGIAAPIASLGGTTTSNTTGTQDKSAWDMAMQIGQLLKPSQPGGNVGNLPSSMLPW